MGIGIVVASNRHVSCTPNRAELDTGFKLFSMLRLKFTSHFSYFSSRELKTCSFAGETFQNIKVRLTYTEFNTRGQFHPVRGGRN